MVAVDIVHGQSGQYPWTEWTISMDSVDIVHGPLFPYSSRTMSMDFLQTGLDKGKKKMTLTSVTHVTSCTQYYTNFYIIDFYKTLPKMLTRA